MNETTAATRVPSPTERVAEVASADQVPAVHRTAQQLEASDEAPPAQTPGQAVSAVKEELTGFGGLTGAIAAVMAEIQAVEKGGKNKFHDYKYARMQDILSVLTPLMGKHGLVIFQTELNRMMFDSNSVLAVQYQFTIAHKSGEVWPQRPLQTGVSKCRNQKDGFDDKAWNKCHTAARKYFLLALFQIPTEDEGEDADRGPANRKAAPVPGPTGHMPPHRLDPLRGEKFPEWAERYQASIKHAKDTAELTKWDNINDDLLGQLSDGNADLYAKLMAYVSTLQTAFASGFTREEPAKAATAESPPPATTAAAVNETASVMVRPDGCPDPEKEPDAFLAWAERRMAGIVDAEALTVVYENEIDPAADGLTPPDVEALQGIFGKHQKRLGGD